MRIRLNKMGSAFKDCDAGSFVDAIWIVLFRIATNLQQAARLWQLLWLDSDA